VCGVIISDGVLEGFKWFGLAAAVIFTILMRATPRAQGARSLGFAAIAAVALFFAFAFRSLGRPIVVVRRSDAPTETTRGVLYFSEDYAFQDGHHERLTKGGPGTLVVNDATTAMRIEAVNYGSIGIGSDPEPVAPMSLHDAKYGIDYVGPNDRPPQEVESNISFSIKYWLRWDSS
jgi:hypothetical protein